MVTELRYGAMSGFEYTVLSALDYEHLIAEITYDGKLVCILDREFGRDNVRISMRDLSTPINFTAFMTVVIAARDDLVR